MGESVKIAIPYSVILDIDRSNAMDFSETVEVKVVDRDHFTMDSYFFAYFHNLPEALAQIREVVKAYKTGPGANERTSMHAAVPHSSTSLVVPAVSDTTLQRSPSAASRQGASAHASGGAASPTGRHISLPMEEQPSSGSQTGGFSFTSLLRPSVPSLPNLLRRTTSPQEIVPQDTLTSHDPAHDFTHVLPDTRASPVPSLAPSSLSSDSATSGITVRPSPDIVQQHHGQQHQQQHHGANTAPVQALKYGLTYPPSTPLLPPTIETTPSDQHSNAAHSHRASWSGVMPSWLKAPSRRLFSVSGVVNTGSGSAGSGNTPVGSAGDLPSVMEQTSRPEGAAEEEQQHRDSEMSASSSNQLGFSMLETPQGFAEHGIDSSVVEKFRKQFALDEKEQLIGRESMI